MRWVALVVLMVVGVLAQMSWLPAVRPFGVVPNLALVLVVLIGLEGSASWALMVGVAGGVILDLAGGANFGLWTGVLTLAALAGGMARRSGVELGGGMVAMLLVASGTVLMTLIIWAGILPSLGSWPSGWMLGRLAFELMVNTGLVLILRSLVRWMARDIRVDG